MRILMISEHFFPRIAGTTEYVHQTCSALSRYGQEVHLLVPGETEKVVEIDDYSYPATALGVGWPPSGDPDRSTRYHFATEALKFAQDHVATDGFDVIHILFGSFVSEKFDTVPFSNAGIPCVQTIHNLPPEECGLSWKGDSLLIRAKDSLRLQLVARKTRFRVRKTHFDSFVVPSNSVSRRLNLILGNAARIETIPHGFNETLADNSIIPNSRTPQSGEPIRLLTVGGLIPHKRQHLIPEITHRLKSSGLQVSWDIAGPSRKSPRYRDAVLNRINSLNLSDDVNVLGPVSDLKLAALYAKANLYVQPSTEEGFCMTALNAASLGIPVIACPTGALPEICEISNGVLVPSSASGIAEAIEHFVAAGLWNPTAERSAQLTRQHYSWLNAAEKLVELYRKLLPCSS